MPSQCPVFRWSIKLALNVETWSEAQRSHGVRSHLRRVQLGKRSVRGKLLLLRYYYVYGRSDSEACRCAWLDGSQGMGAPSKDHLRASSNTSLIALLVLMSVKHRSLRCILVVVAQTDVALQACKALQHWEGAVHTHRSELKCSLQSRRRGSEGPFFPFFGI